MSLHDQLAAQVVARGGFFEWKPNLVSSPSSRPSLCILHLKEIVIN